MFLFFVLVLILLFVGYLTKDLILDKVKENIEAEVKKEVGKIKRKENTYLYSSEGLYKADGKLRASIKVKYFDKNMPKIEKIEKGDWIDLRFCFDEFVKSKTNFAGTIDYENRKISYPSYTFMMLPLGVAMELPKNHEAYILPRSSTYKTYGVIQTNHKAIIDSKYCGDSDQWIYPCYSLRQGEIKDGDRICQFRISEKMPEVEFIEVEHLYNEDRGGFGSTGVK